MFLIREFHRLRPGRYTVTLETDDPGFLPILRIIRKISATAERINTRVDRERRVLHLLDTRHAAEPEERAERARILATFRELPGSRADKIKKLRAILADQYGRCLYDDALAIVSRAIREHRAAVHARAAELAADGRSSREIGATLQISPAQAARIARTVAPAEGDRPGCPRIDDLPRPGYDIGIIPGRCSPGGENQAETGRSATGSPPLFTGARVRGR